MSSLPPRDAAAPADADAFALQGEIWFSHGALAFGGARRIALLAAVGDTGSITAAARVVGLSYKAAWDAIDAMHSLAGEALVVRTAGGKGGGGSLLTERARQLVRTFQALEREHRRFLAHVGTLIDGFAADRRLLERIGMRTSARNQFFGRIDALRPGAVNDEITLRLGSGTAIVATIAHDSVEVLGLAPGVEAFALVEASSIVLTAEPAHALRVSARNVLSGTVSALRRGAVNAEVVIRVAPDLSLCATASLAGIDALGLNEGTTATAMFKASSVIVGISE